MKLTAANVVADALRLMHRDPAVLVAIAGPFWFLPAYAIALFVPPPPMRSADQLDNQGATLAWVDGFGQWLAAQGPWYLAAWAIGLWGTATVYALYLDQDRPDVRGALVRGAALWPRLALASALVGMMAGAGLLLWVLPGLYLLGRLTPVGPALAAEQPMSAVAAISRAFRLTSGNGLALMAVAAATLGLSWMLGQPFLMVSDWLAAQGGGNPVAIAIVDAGAAAVAAAAGLASALIAAAAYRRLAR